ncbi:MAG TPA: carboxypeptidase regulatory-like domain-containing protein [Pyrinomonadaceae bacterium]|nr:carboxypeptidase regulatory-like domain-containing protein [Pyrinomonadaceae bacterium]
MAQSLRAFTCLLALVLCAAVAATAQTSTSRITGTVLDSTGAVVPGASVTALNEATGVAQTQATTDAGLYSFASLPVGVYTITVEKTGFKTSKLTGNELLVNTPLTVDVTLLAGEVSEVVTVQAGAEQLQTANATIGNVVEHKAIEQLPLNGRNPLNLIAYEPGVVQRSQGGVGSGVSVNGSRDRAFNVTIDGIDANESSAPNPTSNLYRLTPDSVQEYKVTTNNATAEEGRNSGASISVATRSGTNDFHGNVFYFLRNDKLNANDFFSNAQGVERHKVKLDQPGFDISGPIRKNKTFFFGSYQRTKVDFSTPIAETFGIPIVYTPAALGGNFRYFRADPTCNATTGAGNCFRIGSTVITQNNLLLVNPTTGALAAGVRECASASDLNCVATYGFSTAANNTRAIPADTAMSALFRSFPAPNRYDCGDGLNTACYVWDPPTSHKGPAYNVRVDHNITQTQNVFVRYLQAKYDTLGGDPLNARPVVFPGFPPQGEVFRDTKNLAIGHRWAISARLVNELTAGFGRFNFLFTQGEANPSFPDVNPFTFFAVSNPYLNTPRTQRAVTVPQILDNLHITRGAHQISTGFNFRFYRHADRRGQPGGVNVTPLLSFDAAIRSPTTSGFVLPATANSTRAGINANDATRLQNYINELAGLPSRLSQAFIGNLNEDAFLPFQSGGVVSLQAITTKLNQYNFYAQDEYKWRPNVTINYGLRWELNPPADTPGYTFVPTTPIAGTPGPANPQVNAPGPVTFAKSDKWWERSNAGAFGPRLGVAWSPEYKGGFFHTLFGDGGRSVVRVGYGLAFDPVSSFQVTAVAGSVPGLRTSCSSTVGGTTTAGCAAVPTTTIAGGFPLALSPPSIKPSSFLTPPLLLNSNAPSITTFAPDLKLPSVHQWNLSFQRELPGGFVAQAAYIGRRGLRLQMAYDINQIDAAPILPSFLVMQNNAALGCTAAGTGCPSGVTGAQPALFNQLVAAFQATGQTQSAAQTSAASFLNSSTVAGQLATNAAGAFAERIENNVLGLRLRPNQQFSRITYIDNSGSSVYHGAQFTLRRRFSSGLGLNMAYTFSKSMDNQSVDPVGTSSGGALSTTTSRAIADIHDLKNEWAPSDFDRTHVLTSAAVWELPVGHGRHFLSDAPGVVNHLLGGWTVNTIYTYMTGEPFQVNSNQRTANAAHVSRALITDPNVRARLQFLPNVLGPVVFENQQGFAIPPPGSNGSGRNVFRGPSYWNVDLGIVKAFSITERVRFQFRTELFNAFNHPNFDNPRSASVGSPSLGSSQFGRTCCTTVAPPTAQTVIQTGESARIIQFGFKLQF